MLGKFQDNFRRCNVTLNLFQSGESGAGKTENGRMVVKFLTNISGNFLPIERSSNSTTSYKSLSNSTSLHKSPTLSNKSNDKDKSSCLSDKTSRSKKLSRVEFDFSYQKCNDSEMMKFCPKHNCCNPIFSSSSSNNSNPIDIPKKKILDFSLNAYPMTSKSFSIYETLNRVHNTKSSPNCKNHKQVKKYCENLEPSSDCSQSLNTKLTQNDFVSVSLDEKMYSSNMSCQDNSQPSYNKNNINLDSFTKSANKKMPTKLNNQLKICLEMKERVAQAETFLEAMGGAKTPQNRDSSRYVKQIKNFILIRS